LIYIISSYVIRRSIHDKFVVVVVVPEAAKVDGAAGAVVSAAPATIFTI
jgi:hypothetical protein